MQVPRRPPHPQRQYNEARPHSSLGYHTPAEIGARRAPIASGSPPKHGQEALLAGHLICGPKNGGSTFPMADLSQNGPLLSQNRPFLSPPLSVS